ncbi:ferritin-like domain-containing protein [Arthrobacter humicola]
MTTWSVVNDETREKRWQDHFPRMLPRYALLACLALVVVSLGVVLTPARPPEPMETPFSERARAAALTETLQLLAAGGRLGTGSPDGSAGRPAGAGNAAVERTVTLLTTQAEALLLPGESPAGAPGASPTVSAPSTPPGPTPSPAAPVPSATGSPTAGTPTSAPPTAAQPATAAELVTALADSGRRRLADAAGADGGMARLLAAVGTAQLLQASKLAAGTGTAAPAPPDDAAPQLSGTCPSESAGAQSPEASPDAADTPAAPDGGAGGTRGVAGSPGSDAAVGAALAAVARTEAQTIYAYQVALPRLDGDAAKSAAEGLARHDALLSGAETQARLHCSTVPPREAGYTLNQSFLVSPAAGLGNVEAAALPVYGDLIALSDGETRQWAVAALLGSAKRAVLWGADPGALPGFDPASLPSLPAN